MGRQSGSLKNDEEPVEPDRPLKWYNYWPLLVIAVEILLNTDYVVVPILMKRGIFFNFPIFSFNWDLRWLLPELSNFEVFIWISLISIPTSLGWYWLWGWIGKVIIKTAKEKEAVKEAVSLYRKIALALKRGGFVELTKDWFVETFNWASSDDNRYLKYLKRGGYLALVIVSAIPISGGRLVATIFCRSINSRKGLWFMIMGETIKNAFIVYGFWNLIFWGFAKL